MNDDEDYSDFAANQLDELEQHGDPDLYDAILDAIDIIFRKTSLAHELSTAFTTKDGIRMTLSVPGYLEYKVFWRTEGPAVVAILRLP